jgi:Predicted membrane protein
MELFHRYGLWGGMRLAHVMFAVMWMGLLWFFNFVQTPAYAEMEPGVRNSAFDKLTWRALWWFRWAAIATLVSGLLILALGPSGEYGSSFWKSPSGMGIAAAILFALIMGYNVWMVIWPKQQIVITNARNVLAGKEADPAAPAAARAGAMASRQNTIFSFAVFLFMVGADHFFNDASHFKLVPAAGVRVVFYIVVLAIAVVMEMNALGKIGGTAAGGTNVIYDTHQYAIYTAVGLMVFFYLFFEIFFRA